MSKLAAEYVIRQAARHAVLRFSSIIGPGMRPGGFVDAAARAARAGMVTVFGDGARLQDYVDVRDAAARCIAAVERRDCFTTLAVSGQSWSNRQVADELASLAGASVRLSGEDTSPSYCYSLEGAVDLGTARHPLRETLQRMLSA